VPDWLGVSALVDVKDWVPLAVELRVLVGVADEEAVGVRWESVPAKDEGVIDAVCGLR